MAITKRVFTAFAIEDENLRMLLVGQRLHPETPFEWTDMSAKEPWSSDWKSKCRTRIKGCDGVTGTEHAEGRWAAQVRPRGEQAGALDPREWI
ncbi:MULTISPECIES: hypothetical protein [Bradyrhizobium]|uniref:hypothetical protein n=1 Tax=Bradyrhizobium TaxID=374 RepID=UPI0018FE14AA|nr:MULTISPECIES: hypothetical protein [Bradyrhizobium]UFW51098.1 hypothetical protein BaraCB756_08735 [Bradyrhizobium arachidis]